MFLHFTDNSMALGIQPLCQTFFDCVCVCVYVDACYILNYCVYVFQYFGK